MALFVDLVALSNGLHGSVQMDSVALFSWIGWLRHRGILSTISIFVATICARAISGSVGYILNRYISFHSKLNPGREMVRYSIVFVCQMAASGILVSLLSVIPIPTVIVKAIIDTILFFVVYNIQKNWVFTEK